MSVEIWCDFEDGCGIKAKGSCPDADKRVCAVRSVIEAQPSSVVSQLNNAVQYELLKRGKWGRRPENSNSVATGKMH